MFGFRLLCAIGIHSLITLTAECDDLLGVERCCYIRVCQHCGKVCDIKKEFTR